MGELGLSGRVETFWNQLGCMHAVRIGASVLPERDLKLYLAELALRTRDAVLFG